MDRESLLESNIEKIEQTYLESVEHGLVSPCVIVVDLSDAVGKRFLELFSELKAKADSIVRLSGSDATLVFVHERNQDFLDSIADLSRSVSNKIQDVASGFFPVIVVADNSISPLALPVP